MRMGAGEDGGVFLGDFLSALTLEPERRAVVGEEKGSPKSRNSAGAFPKADEAVGSEDPGVRRRRVGLRGL